MIQIICTDSDFDWWIKGKVYTIDKDGRVESGDRQGHSYGNYDYNNLLNGYDRPEDTYHRYDTHGSKRIFTLYKKIYLGGE